MVFTFLIFICNRVSYETISAIANLLINDKSQVPELNVEKKEKKKSKGQDIFFNLISCDGV